MTFCTCRTDNYSQKKTLEARINTCACEYTLYVHNYMHGTCIGSHTMNRSGLARTLQPNIHMCVYIYKIMCELHRIQHNIAQLVFFLNILKYNKMYTVHGMCWHAYILDTLYIDAYASHRVQVTTNRAHRSTL